MEYEMKELERYQYEAVADKVQFVWSSPNGTIFVMVPKKPGFWKRLFSRKRRADRVPNLE